MSGLAWVKPGRIKKHLGDPCPDVPLEKFAVKFTTKVVFFILPSLSLANPGMYLAILFYQLGEKIEHTAGRMYSDH